MGCRPFQRSAAGVVDNSRTHRGIIVDSVCRYGPDVKGIFDSISFVFFSSFLRLFRWLPRSERQLCAWTGRRYEDTKILIDQNQFALKNIL